MFEAFTIGPAIIWTRIIFLLIGVWVSVEFFLRLAESANLSLQHFKDRAWYFFGAFIFFGRMFAVIAQYKVYIRVKEMCSKNEEGPIICNSKRESCMNCGN